MKKNKLVLILLSIATVLTTIFLITYWLNQSRPTFDQIIQVTPTPAQSQPCAGTEQSALQRCCQEWADLHNLMTVQCVGEWYLDSGNCAYQCSSSIEIQ